MYCVILSGFRSLRKNEFGSEVLHDHLQDEDTVVIEKISDEINMKYTDSILAEFGIVSGGMLEGVLYSPEYAVEIVHYLVVMLYRERRILTCISIVTGELSGISPDRNKVSGFAVDRALRELNRLKKQSSGHWFQMSLVSESPGQPLIDSMMDLLAVITEKWTDRQREIVWAMSEVSGHQNLAAKKMGITAAAVNKQLKAVGYKGYSAAWDNIKSYLIRIEEDSVYDFEKMKDPSTFFSIGKRKAKSMEVEEAVKYFDTALKLAKKQFGDRDLRMVPYYNGVADTYLFWLMHAPFFPGEKRIPDYVRKFIEMAIHCKREGEKNDLNFVRSSLILGKYYLWTGSFENALKIFARARELVNHMYGIHPVLNEIERGSGDAYMGLHLYEKALLKYRFVFHEAEKSREYNQIRYADSLYAIGLCFEKMKRFPAALEVLRESAEVLETYLPAKHEKVRERMEVLERLEKRG